MQKDTLISILLPAYNAANHLVECLDSILLQSETNWELIAINDQSTDETEQILKAYAQQDQRIQYYKNAQKGIIPALQTAFLHSKGSLLTRMDADDRMAVDKLKLLKEKLITFGQGYVATGLVQYFSEQTLGDGYLKYEKMVKYD